MLAEPMHEQIENLLDAFRKRWGTLRTISMETDWLWLIKPQLTALLTSGKPKPGEPAAFGLIDETAWQKLGESPAKEDASGRDGYHAVVTCYNGQVVHAISGRQSLAVVGMIPVASVTSVMRNDPPPSSAPVPGQEGKENKPAPGVRHNLGYEPQVVTLEDGAVLQVMPIASISGKYVAVDVHSRVAHMTPALAAAATVASPVQGVRGGMDRPRLAVQHLETTSRIPAGSRMLAGGMTFEDKPAPTSANLYLFLRVAV